MRFPQHTPKGVKKITLLYFTLVPMDLPWTSISVVSISIGLEIWDVFENSNCLCFCGFPSVKKGSENRAENRAENQGHKL